MATKPTAPGKPQAAAPKVQVTSRSFMRDDFPLVRRAAITLGICIVLGIALKVASGFFLTKLEARRTQAETELAQAQGKYRAAENEKSEIREFQPRYLDLVKRGFVGDERRLDVIERVRAIQESHQFLPITYDISPQQIFQIDPSVQTGELELRGSKLSMSMGLLHEMDLIILLNEMSRGGVFMPQSCALKRDTNSVPSTYAAQLQGECTFLWVTMGRRPPAEGEAPKPAAQ